MNKYLFQTHTQMKHYNRKNWWVDNRYVSDIRVKADTLAEAVEKYRSVVKDKYYIDISNNAVKGKNKLWITDASGKDIWCGYVFTASMDFQNDSGNWSKQYIELWAEIEQIKPLEEAV